MQGYRRVAIVEEFYHILKQIHDKDCLHAGSRKTYARVSSISMQLKSRYTCHSLYTVGPVIVLLQAKSCG